MRKLLVISLIALGVGGFTVSEMAAGPYAQSSQQTFDSNMRNANEVSGRMQQQQDHQATTQNGTSQYSGPKGYSSDVSGAPVVGYQKSIK